MRLPAREKPEIIRLVERRICRPDEPWRCWRPTIDSIAGRVRLPAE